MSSSTALTVHNKSASQLDMVISDCDGAMQEASGEFVKATILASAMCQLRELITDEMMKPIMALQGSRLGFKTDKDKDQGYPAKVVKECIIQAALMGLKPVGNQFNIIAGNVYITKEGFTAKMLEYKPLTDLKLVFGLPKEGERGAIVPCSATWKIDGKTDSLVCEGIPVKKDSYTSIDAVLGKAERKLRSRIWTQITGSVLSDGDADDNTAPSSQLQPSAPITVSALSSKKARQQLASAQQPSTLHPEPPAAVDTKANAEVDPREKLVDTEEDDAERAGLIRVLEVAGINTPKRFADHLAAFGLKKESWATEAATADLADIAKRMGIQ